MRSWKPIVVAASAALIFSSPAVAQFSLALDGSRAVAPSQVAQRPDVQKELGLLPGEIRELKNLDEATRHKTRKDFEALAQFDPAVRDKKRMDLVRKTSAEQNKALGGILKPEQMKRLKQVTWQIGGSQTFKSPEIEDLLDLTVDQKAEIQRIMKAAIANMADLFQQDKEGIEKARDKADTIRWKALEDVVAVLTPGQKAKFDELKGPTFHFKRSPTLAKLMDPVWSKGDVVKPADNLRDVGWVTERSESWAPADDERKMDLIGWADGLIPALRLARQHNRPVFIFTLDGELGRGRC